MLLQAALTIMFIAIGGGFRSLMTFSVVASWAFYFLTVLGLVILRVKEPLLERPYKTWIITPLTFCAVALFLLCMPVLAAPLQAISVLCKSDFLPHSGMCTMISPARLRSRWYTSLLHYKSERGHSTAYNRICDLTLGKNAGAATGGCWLGSCCYGCGRAHRNPGKTTVVVLTEANISSKVQSTYTRTKC
jgi:amino acid transporter